MNISKHKKFIPKHNRAHSGINFNLLIESNVTIDLLENILSSNKEIVNRLDDKGETILSYAISRKNNEICLHLLNHQSFPVRLDYKDKEGNGYLHKAIWNDNIEVVEVLIKRGIDINGQNDLGNTPLHVAAMKADSRSIKLLLMNKVNISIENNNGETALVYAKKQGNLRCVNAILKKKCFSHLELNTNDINMYPISSYDRNKSLYDQFNQFQTGIISTTLSHKHINEELSLSFSQKKQLYTQLETFHDKDTNDNDNELKEERLFANRQGDLNELLSKPHLIFDDIDETNNINNDSIQEIISNQQEQIMEELNEDTNLQYSSSCSSINESMIQEGELMLKIDSVTNDIDIREKTPVFNQLTKYEEIESSPVLDQECDLSNELIKVTFQKETHSIDQSFGMENHNESKSQCLMNITTNETSDLYLFLKEINLEQYFSHLQSNGFDDIELIIQQTKCGLGITDKNLREASIKQAGDRAKIIIRLQELAENFDFCFPHERVYHISNDIDNDPLIDQLASWLSEIKMSNYLHHFINQGYYCLDTILMQIASKQPITDALLEKAIFIDKIGYRVRLMNKLQEETKMYIAKYKSKDIIVDKLNQSGSATCQCLIF